MDTVQADERLLSMLTDPRRLPELLTCLQELGQSPATQAQILRDLCGNPWRPVKMPLAPTGITFKHKNKDCLEIACPWLTPLVRSLALAAYTERRRVKCEKCKGQGSIFDPKRAYAYKTMESYICHGCNGTGYLEDGTLCKDRLAVLSDALEDSGCSNVNILNHLRGPGTHFRGCWVIDLLTGQN